MSKPSKETIDEIKQLILKEAREVAEAAAHNGERHDGGASVLEAQVRFYTLGQQGTLPVQWKKYEKYLDPEWKEFQRLKEKFGDK